MTKARIARLVMGVYTGMVVGAASLSNLSLPLSCVAAGSVTLGWGWAIDAAVEERLVAIRKWAEEFQAGLRDRGVG